MTPMPERPATQPPHAPEPAHAPEPPPAPEPGEPAHAPDPGEPPPAPEPPLAPEPRGPQPAPEPPPAPKPRGPQQPAAPGPGLAVPGDRPPRRLLDHPPSDRFVARDEAASSLGARRAGSFGRAIALGSLVAAAGAAVHVVAAIPLEWTGGLLLVAVTAGFAVGTAVRRGGGTAMAPGRRRLAGIVLALAAVTVALALNWAMSPRYLDPAAYLDQVYGALVPIQALLAAGAALAGTR